MKRNDGLHATFVMHISTERTSWKDMFGVKLFSFLTIYVFFPFEPLASFFCVTCRNFFLRSVQTFFCQRKLQLLLLQLSTWEKSLSSVKSAASPLRVMCADCVMIGRFIKVSSTTVSSAAINFPTKRL